ncbi:MAG: hypothetical protein C4533_07690 [Candidatus Omnitrophota bacterium]|jgi:hypothetical protein|nr:MAG: hypothetical protein C4533_07690 [Candidatus Omnitrophota bacterium]
MFDLRSVARGFLCCAIIALFLFNPCELYLFAQEDIIELNLNASSATVITPKIFRPNIDLSGRGHNNVAYWPQELASPESIETWKKAIGFSGMYRIQYNLWEISESKERDKLLNSYEEVIKNINDAGGIVILDIFGTPAGMGRILDKRSAVRDYRAFKELIKSHINRLSVEKKYNIWYEVWSAPDLDDFFLGGKQDYLNLYRAVAEAVKELRAKSKIYISLGGPSVSWWFQNFDGANIIKPERSLIYELIKYCSRYNLPLDFISWHAYSTDPKTDQEMTVYNKNASSLIRDWLSYFRLDRNIPIIIDEWNYDSGPNVIPERRQNCQIAASFIPARIKYMHLAGINYQQLFSLEDFYDTEENVIRNIGIFWFDQRASGYKGGPKSLFSVYKMLLKLGDYIFTDSLKADNEFVGMIASKSSNELAIIVYSYIDPVISKNYVSRNISSLSDADRKSLLGLFSSGDFDKLISREIDITKLRVRNKLKNLLKKAQELKEQANSFASKDHTLRLNIKNINGDYVYQRYVVDAVCISDCDFAPAEEKDVSSKDNLTLEFNFKPYSVNLLVLKNKPQEVKSEAAKLPQDTKVKQENAQ